MFHLKGHPSLYFLKYFWALLLFPTLLISCSGNRKIFTAVEKELSNSVSFQKSFTGLAVYDPVKKMMLFEYNSGKYFIPASNTKLLTYYTGLKLLGDSVPGIRYSLKNDSLIFTGTGDPSLLNRHLPKSKVIDFLKRRQEKLFYIPSSSSVKKFGPGWAWDDYNDYYSAERSELPVYGNIVKFSFKQGTHEPVVSPSIFTDSLSTYKVTSKYSRIQRDLNKNIFRYNHSKIQNEDQEVPFKTSVENSIKILEDTLERKIEILDLAANFQLQRILLSIPANNLYSRMLQDSDNFIAEQVLLMVANKISDTLETKIAIKYMKELHFNDLPDELKWVDGSGLSRYNLTTPRNTIKLLEKIKNEVPYVVLFELLPAGGKSGTLKDLFKGEAPYIFAKSGSLSNNYSLSGFLLTKKGKVLLFSFMNNNFMTPSSQIKQEVEQVLKRFRNTK